MGIITKKKKEKKPLKTIIQEFPSEVKKDWKKKILILMIAPLATIIDQITKSLIVHFIPLGGSLWGLPYDGLFRIIHVRNTAIAFGIGTNFADELKAILFIILPLILILALILYSLYKNGQPLYQQIAFALIIGGGCGNLIDRIFRPGNVVDFIDTIWFGIRSLRDIPILNLLSFERWPTWNIADGCVVVAVAILLVGMFGEDIKKYRQKKKR